MKFTPSNTFVGRNPDGSSFRVQEWDYFDLVGVDLIGAVFIFIVSIFVGAFIGPLLVLFTILKFDGRVRIGHFLAICVCSLVLYDFNNAWLGTCVFYLFMNENQIDYLVILNVISLVLITFLTIFGKLLHVIISLIGGSVKACKAIFTIILLIVIAISYIKTRNFLDENSGWLSMKTGIEQAVDKPLD
jgi:hypothetical protein